ncbi:MAG: hypothetical protein O3C20_14685 [Verrucomicrobia bacterium]|nr:hypothetical protein [Verrucomicrobiota bacterium]
MTKHPEDVYVLVRLGCGIACTRVQCDRNRRMSPVRNYRPIVLMAFKHHVPDVHTPNMDRLAAPEILFSNAYVTDPDHFHCCFLASVSVADSRFCSSGTGDLLGS